MTKAGPLLDVNDLTVEIATRHGALRVLDQVSLSLERSEVLGVVGESGAGKSMLGNAIAGLLEPPASVTGGEVALSGRRIDSLSRDAARRVLGREIGMVFQDPLTSLDPLFSIGDQLEETIRVHLSVGPREARDTAVKLLEETGLPAARSRLDDYPHQFSGGMRQRVVLALALCANPQLVIADEPTTALDVSIQAQIIRLLQRMCLDHGTAVILITHDMGVIADASERVAVMYAGRIVEIGPTSDVISRPRHPYTQGLMGAIPPLKRQPRRLEQINGNMPRADKLLGGCSFHPRCPLVFEKCRHESPVLEGGEGHAKACWLDG
ncbi:ABC transporter ATP-binding protein [Ruegeria sp.]|uniref:ABC transporter ATP-binding protein n=1 Tax=Ruegeria sp. TaxID=1879320 RepID=UPI00230A3235|nr:ABC transporter ATP-binding protein [Ruegeria sp.]MDA7967004.1 ABC transporter ATP-binding protein [Ruegeria sp.]